MSPRKDISGLRFGRLLVISFSHLNKHDHAHWLCRCDCENQTEITVCGTNLRKGHTQSCGCLWREKNKTGLNHKHGHATAGDASPEYRTWCRMMNRCYNPNYHEFKNYGGRSIKVFEPWHDFQVFLAYLLATIGLRPAGKTKSGRALYSIDRTENDGDYEPGNIRWATTTEQANNTSRSLDLPVDVIIQRYQAGESLNMLRAEFGVSHGTIKRQLERAGVLKPKGVR